MGATPTVEAVSELEERLSVVTNAIGSEIFGADGRPLAADGTVVVSDVEVATAKRAAVRVLRDLAELDLAKTDERITTTGEWITHARELCGRGMYLQAQRVILDGLAAERGL